MHQPRPTVSRTILVSLAIATLATGCGTLQQMTGVQVPDGLSGDSSSGSTRRSAPSSTDKGPGPATADNNFPDWLSNASRDIGFWADKLSTQEGRLKDRNHAESFIGAANQYDYVGTMRTIDAKIAKNPSLMQQRGIARDVESLRKLKPKLDQQGAFVAREMRSVLDDLADMQKDGDLLPTKNVANQGIRVCDAVQKVTTDLAQVTEVRAELVKVIAAVDAQLDKMYAGPFHKANLNKVVFSSRPLVVGREDTNLVRTSFTAGDRIYGTAYLDQALSGASGKLSIILREDGRDVATYETDMAKGPDGTGRLVFPLEIAPDPATATQPGMGARLASKLADLPQRKRNLELAFFFQQYGMSSGATAATGAFELDTATGHDTLAKTGEVLVQRVIAETRMPKAKKKDGALEKQILAAIPKAGWKETPLRAVITDADWTPYTNRVTGIVVSRDIAAAVAVKDQDGACRYFNLRVYQNAMGRGFTEAQLSITYLAYEMDCANVAK